jgi:hypothetical protein
MTTLEILKAARDKILRGWCQGRMSEAGYKYCALGALYAIDCTQGRLGRSPRAEAINLVSKSLPAEGKSLSHWNDVAGRTQAEVIDLFDRAIAAEEGRGT